MSHAKILVVDDTPLNLKVLFEYLNEAGFKILVATNGKRAIAQASSLQPDLILLDVMMPEMDGFETCYRLKQNKETQDIPVIFVTALSDTNHKMQGFEAGGVDYITKPFQQQEVLARVKTHITLRRLQKSLHQQVAELDAFARTVAHDLKSPLGVITISAELLCEAYKDVTDKRNLTPKQQVDLTNSIQRSANKAVEIVNALLLLAHINRDTIEIEPVDMEKVVKQAIYSHELLIEQTQAHIEIEAPETWPTVLGYVPWLEQVWVNYLSNAMKYGGSKPKIRLGAELLTQENEVRFWVSDDGPGIAQEQLGTLFTEFTRLRQDETVKGDGLGLTTVERIIKRLGGKVGVDSKLNQGSEFYFTLPIPHTESDWSDRMPDFSKSEPIYPEDR